MIVDVDGGCLLNTLTEKNNQGKDNKSIVCVAFFFSSLFLFLLDAVG